jgi:hypothetical protein
MNCVICKQPFGSGDFEDVSQFAAYGGLPSPCCGHCFEANDFSVKDLAELQIKSLLRRSKFDNAKKKDEGNYFYSNRSSGS